MKVWIRHLPPDVSNLCRLRWLIPIWLLCALLCGATDASDYKAAEEAIRGGHWQQGIALLEPYVRQHPRDPKAWNLMGLALTGKGEPKQADEKFRQALKIDPRFYPAQKNLAVNEFNLKEFAAAERDFTAAGKLSPSDPVINTFMGELEYRRNDFGRAASHFAVSDPFLYKDPGIALHAAKSYFEIGDKARGQRTLEILLAASRDAHVQFEAGLLLAQHGLFSDAIPHFQAARAAFPDSYDTAYNLAFCLKEAKQFPAAIDVIEDAISRGNKTAEAYDLLAQAYEGNMQGREALEALQQAIALAPADERNYLDFAAICLLNNFDTLGLEAVNAGLKQIPNSERLIFQRGVFNARLNQYDAAEKDFARASRLAPEKDLAYVGLGMTYLQEAHLPEVIRVVRQRMEQKQGAGDPMLFYLLGEALIREGVTPGKPEFAQAQTALEKSVKLNPQYSRSHVDLAKLYLMEGRVDEAIAHLEKARALDPKNTSVYSHLAVAYRRKGETAAAKSALETLTKLNAEDLSHVYPVEKAMKEGQK